MKKKKFFLSLSALYGLSALSAFALPPYANLFKAKYGYRPNCTLCHNLDDWEPNGYGKLFSKNGRSIEALGKIESLDPDEDKAVTSEEIKAQSNPGDPRSTPKRIGDWLKNLEPVHPPKKRLLALFPGKSDYVFEERELAASARRDTEKSLGKKLRDEDFYPSYFVVKKEDKTVGYALYASAASTESCFFLAGYAPSPQGVGALQIAGVAMLHCHQKLIEKPEYLSQYKGKAVSDLATIKPPKPELKAYSDSIADSVSRGAAVLAEVLK